MTMLRPRNEKDVKLSQERMYDLVKRPVVTEKYTMASEHNQVVFVVPLDAA